MADLSLLCDVILPPLRRSGALPKEAEAKIFSNIEAIRAVHAELLHDLQGGMGDDAAANDDSEASLARTAAAFERFCPFLCAAARLGTLRP